MAQDRQMVADSYNRLTGDFLTASQVEQRLPNALYPGWVYFARLSAEAGNIETGSRRLDQMIGKALRLQGVLH